MNIEERAEKESADRRAVHEGWQTTVNLATVASFIAFVLWLVLG